MFAEQQRNKQIPLPSFLSSFAVCKRNVATIYSKDTLPLGSQDISLRKKTVVSIKDPVGLQIVPKRNLCEAKRPFHSLKPFFALVFKRLFLAEIS
jgi:hypothetical protein